MGDVNNWLERISTNGDNSIARETNLYHAVKLSGDIRILVQLLLTTDNVNEPSEGGRTPLHQAAGDGNVGLLKMLIKAGAEVNAVTNNGDTAIHLAALNGHLNVVRALANRGAELTLPNNHGKTAESLARLEGYEDVADFLKRIEEDVDDYGIRVGEIV